ncbi:MAG: hypothetical protein COA42_18235 [Alteromonadaceae bacterium]|nr:MAG: hypothetical protein COA42_18235 [Alteromonadaceae bacterium]
MLYDAIKIISTPKTYLAELDGRQHEPYWGAMYTALLALLPALAFYYGTAIQGWSIGERVIRIAEDGAIWLALMFYVAMIAGTIVTGFALSWMSKTYRTQFSAPRAVETVAVCGTPVFLAGTAAAYPIFWLDFLLALAAATYGFYLIYLALRIRLKLTEEMAFLYTCAALASVLILIVCLMVGTIIAWEHISTPVFV